VSPDDVSVETELQRLRARLERERRARQEAEAIAERGLRELYKRQQELLVVEAVAEAANTAPTVDETMRFALEKFSEFAGWPVGHLCLAANDPSNGTTELVPTDIWHVSGRDRYDALRRATATLQFPAGTCLPGRVADRREPVWIADLRGDPSFLRGDAAVACGLRFAFAFPIRVGLEVAAVLEFFAEEAPTPNADLLRLATHLGTQLGRVIERKRAADRISDAYQDPLTGLPNRALLLEDLELAIRRQKQMAECQFAVLFLDLDGFKVVNDTLGHLAGDRLIVEFTRRIVASVRQRAVLPRPAGVPEQRPDTVARLGGDEFVVLLNEIKDVSNAIRVAERILHVLAQPFHLEGQQLTTSASIGIALSASGYEAAQDVLRDADSAMYRAKASGKARYAVFDTAMHERGLARLQLEGDLRLALQREELRLHYQPVLALEADRVVGFEALIRWQHPERGLLRPADFIAVAEETGLIQAIGQWTFRTACRQAREWISSFDETLTMAVNVSAKQFADPALARLIAEVLRTTDLPARNLRLELTESVTMQHVERSAGTLAELKELGVGIAIDDFGTGFSSLTYLYRFPVDVLKIDATFVSRMHADPASREIVRAIIALAVALDLGVVAEGIESARALAHLRQIGCDFGQGYYLAGPLDPHTAARFVERHRAGDRGYGAPPPDGMSSGAP
jgi:diguanylate cyclase (GGDEF)-like protein